MIDRRGGAKRKLILIITLLSLVSLICINVPVAQLFPGGHGTVGQMVAQADATLARASKVGGFINKNWGAGKATAIVAWLFWVTLSASNNYKAHITDYALLNPDPTNPELLRVMFFFISVAQAFYLVSITITGFYLLFISGSARGRAQAKYLLGKLVIGMILVLLSPLLLQLMLGFSYLLTDSILSQTDPTLVSTEYSKVFWAGFTGELYTLFPAFYSSGNTFLLKRFLGNPNFPVLRDLLDMVEPSGSTGPIILYPYFLTVVSLVFTFGFLAFRYLMVMLWSFLLPLSIFFMTFTPTKNIGRTMMEQTFQWTFFQVFYALTIVALSIGLSTLPAGYKDYGVFFLGLHSMIVFGAMFVGPWYMSSLLQRLFPP